MECHWKRWLFYGVQQLWPNTLPASANNLLILNLDPGPVAYKPIVSTFKPRLLQHKERQQNFLLTTSKKGQTKHSTLKPCWFKSIFAKWPISKRCGQNNYWRKSFISTIVKIQSNNRCYFHNHKKHNFRTIELLMCLLQG